MNLLGKFLKPSDITKDIIDKGFAISECSFDCDSCTTKFPSSVKIEEGKLWNSTDEYDLHIVVATGKNDWNHDACLTSGTVGNGASQWASKSGKKFPQLGSSGNIKVSMSSITSQELEIDDEYIEEKRGDLLLLPFFIWIKNVTAAEVGALLDIIVPRLVEYRDRKIEPPSTLRDFPSVTVQIDSFQSYIFLCSHKTRDKRCGITAPIMKREMEVHLRDLGLIRDHGDHRPGGIKVAFINHVGGHKFSANVLIYSKTGKNIWLARCKPQNVKPIIDECILADGKVWPESIRRIQKFNAIEW